MAFATLDSESDHPDLAEINMVPLIDVMLVLLIIFMVTAPLLTHSVQVELPKAVSAPTLTKPYNVQLAIDARSRLFWNGEIVDAAQFTARLSAAGALATPPELHIRAERTTPYDKIAQVMSEAARYGVTKIGFVTDPRPAR